MNQVWRCWNTAEFCTYHLGTFGDTVVDIMRRHPMVIIAGMLQENLLFVPPEEFLREVHQQLSRQTASPSPMV
jgi:hypothetical protein